MNYFNGGIFPLLTNASLNSIYINNKPCPPSEVANLSVYSNEVQTVEIGYEVQFPVIEIKNGITYDTSTGKATIEIDGDYSIIFFVNSNAGQITIFKNGVALPPAGSFPVSGGGIYPLVKGDVIDIRNTSTLDIVTAITTGSEASAPTKLIINKVS